MRLLLVKSEPSVYSFDQLRADGQTAWTGVRSAQARNFLQEMRLGDSVLYYHSNEGKEVVGLATVVRAAYPDPTAGDDPRWVAVDLAADHPLPAPVSLATFKADPLLQGTFLVRQGRLSVTPLTPEQFARVLELGADQ